MNDMRKSFLCIIFLSVFLMFAAVSCGDGVSDSGDKNVTVRLKMDGLFEESGVSSRTSVGGHPVHSLYLDVAASGWSGLRLNLAENLAHGDSEVELEITAGKIYKFTVSAYTSGNMLICSGSESVMIQANSEVNIGLVCALQIDVDLSPSKVEGIMNLLDYQNLPAVYNVMGRLAAAVDDGVNLGEVQDAVAEAEVSSHMADKSKNTQSYRNLLASLKALKQSSLSAFNAFKNMVNAFENTAELKAAAEIMESVLDEGLKPEISVTPVSVDFENVEVSTLSSTETVMITNTGNFRLNINSITASPHYTFQVDLTGGSAPCGSGAFTLVPQESCTVTVKAFPAATGVTNGTLDVTSSDAAVAPASSALKVNGTASASPVITSSSSKLDFGAVATGGSITKTITLTNISTAAATGITASFSGANGYTETNTCTSLAGGQSCTISVRFQPVSSAGQRDAVMTVSSNAADVEVDLKGYSVLEGTLASEVVFEDTGFTSLTEKSVAVCPGGTAHAVFPSNGKLTYGFFDGTKWMLSDMGVVMDEWDLAVVTADSDCMPHVAYTSEQTLHYAQSRTSGFWQHYEIDTAMVLRMNGAVSIDSDGTDIYISSINDGTSSVVVDKTTDFGTNFTRRTVATALPGPESTMLKIDSAGLIHVVFSDSDGIHYANSASDPWVVDEEIADGYNPTIAFSGTEVHVIYNNNGLYEVIDSGAGWSPTPIEIDAMYTGGFSALSVGGNIELYYKYTESPRIMKKTYSGGWSAPEEFYDNTINFFTGNNMLAASAAPNGDTVIVYDKNALLSSKSRTSGVWDEGSNPVALLVGINSNLSFDVEFKPEGTEFYGVMGDFIYDTSGGLYMFNLDDGGVESEALDRPESYIVRGTDMLVTDSGRSVCYVYELNGGLKLGYYDGDTHITHGALDDASSKTCTLEKDSSGNIYVAYGDSTAKPTLRKVGAGITGGLTAGVSETGMSMKFADGKLYFAHYDSVTEKYMLKYFSNDTGIEIASASPYTNYADMAVSSAGTLVYAANIYDTMTTESTVKIFECEADLSSCSEDYSYTTPANSSALAVSLTVDSDDNVYVGVIESQSKVILLKGVLGDAYSVETIEDFDDASSGTYNGMKVITDPVTKLVSVFYRNGDKLIHTTESLIPVLDLSHVYKNFGEVYFGMNSPEFIVTVSNNGTQVMEVEDIRLDYGDNFILLTDYGTGACPDDDFTLYPESECTVKVKFRPYGEGALGDRLIVETDRSTKMTNLFGIGKMN